MPLFVTVGVDGKDSVTRLEAGNQILIFPDIAGQDDTFSFNDGSRLETKQGLSEAAAVVSGIARDRHATQPLVVFFRSGGCRVYPPEAWPPIGVR
jgi:hypothetical protein